MKVGTKIILVAALSILLAVVVGVFIQRSVVREQGVNLTHEKMRSILLEAEDVRNSVSQLADKGAFDYNKLQAELSQVDDYRHSTIYFTIPVVAAMNALDHLAEKENLMFQVVRENARNPEHEANAYQKEILKKFENGDKEFFTVDESKGLIVYAKPIFMTQDCMTCHGDPQNSPTGDGKDILGFQMEGWKAGDMKGAYIISATMDGIDRVVAAGMKQYGTWIFPIMILICAVFYFLVKTSIIKPLELAINSTRTNAVKTESTSKEITTASHMLAEGACEQAASVEETSASLEEIEGSTKMCSDNAQEAAQLAMEAQKSASQGNESMNEMMDAMQAIKASSGEVAQVIKTIDEIAFQTNILSLNASVEAARAGEAGAGFAVVAEEVRNLAQRSATAAKDTAAMIENSTKRSDEGFKVCARVQEDLKQIVERIERLSNLVKEVDASAKEQRQGVMQINEAVSQIDKVTQQSASGAQDAANHASDLDLQAKELKKAIDSLYKVING